ncbi:MAG: hypothetical protein P4K98_09280 [Bryobacteraceae bacterium]|nr:hypothetical protein [Bryobacteraceae bacterium]
MMFPLALPDWVPWWVPIAVMVPALLYLLVFLLMPFSVFGLKGRLEAIEARLDDLQDEIRAMGSRPGAGTEIEDGEPLASPALERAPDARRNHPPIPSPVPPPRDYASYQSPQEPPSGATAPRPRAPATPPGNERLQPAGDRQLNNPPLTVSPDADSRRQSLARPGRPGRTEPRLGWPR